MSKKAGYSKLIKDEAIRLGFSDCGIAPVHYLAEEMPRLKRWLDDGMYGEMGYMVNHFEKRLDPGKLVDNARSVVSVLLNYFPSRRQVKANTPVVAKYALGKDYHYIVKDRLNRLFDFVNREVACCVGRPFVDSAPVLDRVWARKAGLGWIGKNSMLISPKYGSWVFIGELVLDIELEYDMPFEEERCGSCTRCIDECPTGAIVSPRRIDSRKCISYITIGHKSEIPGEFCGKLKNRVFGCDICQDVCPWNRRANPCNIPDFSPGDFIEMPPTEWQELDKPTFKKLFAGTAIEHLGYKRLRRNIDFLFRT